MNMTTERYNWIVFITMLLGTLGGVASIVLMVLDQRLIGGIMIICWIPAIVGCLEWRCREKQLQWVLRPRPSSITTGNLNLPAPLEVMNSLAQQERLKTDSHITVVETLPIPADIRINIAPNSPGSK